MDVKWHFIPRHTDESNLRTRTEQQDGVEDEEIESPVAEQLCESSAEKSESENQEVEKDNNSQEQVWCQFSLQMNCDVDCGILQMNMLSEHKGLFREWNS